MKIDGPPKIRGTQLVKPSSKTGLTATRTAPGVNPIEDSVTIMGIPSAEMTPKVKNAIMALMAEVDTLRNDLALAHRRIDELERLVDLDPLVPVSNRRAFVREVSRAISFAERYGTKSTLIFFDVNNMKTINDTFGHAAGDKALMHVAEHLSEGVRDLDVVGRLGGDEFGVLLAQIDEEKAHNKALDLIGRVENNPIDWNGAQMHVYLAHGGYSFGPGQDPAEALAEADRKMYENKKARKVEK
jgi:diguanylate cyclase (GGDEF)-like protein